MPGYLTDVADVYEKLWQESSAAFERGCPKLDPFLRNRSADHRRGITLIFRPGSNIRKRASHFLREVADVAPGQHFYQPSEFHVTVMAVMPGSEFWREHMKRLPAFLAVLSDTLKKCPAFSVAFRGVTASPEAVLIQGFPADNTLAQLRDDLRAAFRRHRLGENLDRRYKVIAAHITAARFSTPLPDWKPLQSLLSAHRHTDFGQTHVRSLQLIENDWYASAQTVRTLCEYPLV